MANPAKECLSAAAPSITVTAQAPTVTVTASAPSIMAALTVAIITLVAPKEDCL